MRRRALARSGLAPVGPMQLLSRRAPCCENLDVHAGSSSCGKPAGLGPVCESCGKQLHREDLIAEQAPKYKSERERRWEAFKAGR
jgi:hypothetical protein